jgi:quercetin dioxygenase-like cupin family protein
MQLVTEPRGAIDLAATPVHLALGSRALVVEGFGWDAQVLDAYATAVAGDGADGRLVMIFDGSRSWDAWERHPAGDELVVCLSGRIRLIQELGGRHHPIVLEPGQAMINPPGVWHTADIEEPVRFLAITPGQGTEHRPR